MRALITLVFLFMVAGINCLPLDTHMQQTKTADEDDSRLAADNIDLEFAANEADPEFAADDINSRLATDAIFGENSHLIPDGEADNAADMEYYKQLIRNTDEEKDRENDEDEDDDDDGNDDAEENGDEDLFEGDIVSSDSLMEKLHPEKTPPNLFRNARLGPEWHWPNRVLPYKFVDDYALEAKRKVIKFLTRLTKELNAAGECVVVRPKLVTDERFVIVTNKDRCSSRVGHDESLSKSGQPINLGYKCIDEKKPGRIQHEFIHALGFWHEQSRSDRNDSIVVVMDNVKPGKWKNFKIRFDSNNQGFPYDYGSVMHYPKYAFATDRSKPTIITKNGAKIGQRKGASKQDIAEIRRYYGCYEYDYDDGYEYEY